MNLVATRDGFEGLAGLIVDRLSGSLVRLMPSGDQHGPDGVTDVEPGPRRAMQAKRYKDGTPLRLGELISEMERASRNYAFVETWVLVTTKTLLAKEAEVLNDLAEQLGWTLVVLDWSVRQGVPALAAACAALGDEADDFITDPAARAELEALRDSGAWCAAGAMLQAQLRSADAGFEPMRLAATGGLEAIYREPAEARAQAGPSPTFLASAPPVVRERLRASLLDTWGTGAPLIALLGLEGVGKTWAALDVLWALSHEACGPLPITVSAERALATSDALTAVLDTLRAVSDRAGRRLRDPDLYWRRKLRLWRTALATPPRIVVLVDGLDEALAVRWNAFIAPLLQSYWNGLFRVILTCREDEWRRDVGLDRGALAPAAEVKVGAFEVAERDAYLAQRGISVDQLSKDVAAAALHPRTAFHLTRLTAELPDLTRITREQLLLKDYENTWIVKDGRALDPADFHRLVCELAASVRAAAAEKQAFQAEAGQLVSLAAEIAGADRKEMRQVLSDLVGGKWLRRDADTPSRLVFQDDMLPAAIGMALAQHLRPLSHDKAASALAKFLEPWSADDLAEPLLRMCATALLVRGAPDELCEVVLEAWTARPLRNQSASDVWRRLHVFRPALFLRFCDKHAARGHTWLHEWAVACFWEDHPACRPEIEAAVFGWASAVALPEEKEGWLGRAHRRQRARIRILRRTAKDPSWPERLSGASRPGLASCAIACRIICLLPRRSFVAAIAGWAVSAAMVDAYDFLASLRWLLRANVEDPEAANAAVRAAAESLETLGDAISRRAAGLLFDLTGDPADAERTESLIPGIAGIGEPLDEPDLSEDAIARLDRAVALADGGRPHLNELLLRLAAYRSDPTVTLPPTLSRHIAANLAAHDLGDMRRMVDFDWGGLDSALRWAPQAAADAVAATALDVLKLELPNNRFDPAYGAFPLTSLSTRAASASILRDADRDEDAESGRTLNRQSKATALNIAGRPLRQQAELLLHAMVWPEQFGRLLSSPEPGDLEFLLGQLDWSAPEAELSARLRILHAVFRSHSTDKPPDMIDWTAAFARPEPKVRLGVLTLASEMDAPRAAAVLRDLGWTYVEAGEHPPRFLGSDVLANLPEAELMAVLPRLDDPVLAHLAARTGGLAQAAADLWLERIRTELTRKNPTWTSGGDRWWYKDADASHIALVRRHGAELAALIEAIWADGQLKRNITHGSGLGAAWPLLRALAPTHPALVKPIWREVVRDRRGPRSRRVEAVAAKLPIGLAFDDLRLEWYDDARNDADLMDAVVTLEARGHRDLILAAIDADLGSDRPLRRARGLTAAGFLQKSDAADHLWRDRLATPAATGWLRYVHGRATADYERECWMRHWGDRVLTATTEAEAFAAHRMLRPIVDDRFWSWWNVATPPQAPGRLQWINFLADGLSKACGTRREDLAKQRCHVALCRDTVMQPRVASNNATDAGLLVIVA